MMVVMMMVDDGSDGDSDDGSYSLCSAVPKTGLGAESFGLKRSIAYHNLDP